jgi:hypothetical protein
VLVNQIEDLLYARRRIAEHLQASNAKEPGPLPLRISQQGPRRA